MKLLLSVFLTPDYITKYRTPAINKKSQSKFDRIDKFLTMVESISIVDWESVDIYLSFDPKWEKFKPAVSKYLNDIYPNRILGERLSLISHWINATKNYDSQDVVLLQTNDDHLLVPNSKSYLDEIENKLKADDSIKMASLTHFPEFRGLLHRDEVAGTLDNGNTILVNSAIGTILVKGHFLHSWFHKQSFPSDLKLVRPDNPFGKSVIFSASKLLIPERELMRHMDGYSHALLYRPLPPIRNTKLFSGENNEIIDLAPWKIGLWPMAQFGYRGKGVDFYKQDHEEDESFLVSLRTDIANQISLNALAINLRSSLKLINIKYRDNYLYKSILSLFLFSNLNILRNTPDLIIQKFFFKSTKGFQVNDLTLKGRRLLIFNLGFTRGQLLFYMQKYWWLMPKNAKLTYLILRNKFSEKLKK
jgi:hypothetical protein